jgi:CcmD family protein
MKKFLFTLFLLLSVTLAGIAQGTGGVEMATDLRSSGKIYVVVAVLSVIFIGLVLYLFSIDNRLKKIEKQK